MFGMAGETAFDIRFTLFGIPVRIHPIFWVSGAMLCWNPERLDLVLLGIVCVFISILVHELGHALVLRRYGWPSEIVLYFLGGYATATRLPTWRQVASLAAGPAAGLTLGVFTYVLLILGLEQAPQVMRQFPALGYTLRLMLFTGFIVNLMNLLPVVPLDGGQILATLLAHYGPRGRRATELTLQISIGSAGLVALWCAMCLQNEEPVLPSAMFAFLPKTHAAILYSLQPDPKFLMIFFGVLCVQSVIDYNNLKSWR